MNFCRLKYSLLRLPHSSIYKRYKVKASRLANEEGLYTKTLKELSEYTGENQTILEKKAKDLSQEASRTRCDQLTEKELDGFYKKDQHYLYELPLWNAQSGRCFLIWWTIDFYLRKNRCTKILDYGAGAGDLCLALAKQPQLEIFYYDINDCLRGFAAWRFEQRHMKVNILNENDFQNHSFDCILAFDIFEHLKNLDQRLKWLAGLLRDKGSFIFNIELSGEGLHLEENKVYGDEKKLDRLLEEAGFRFDWKFKRYYFYKRK